MCCLSVQYMILPCCCHVLSLWLGNLGLMFVISGLLGTLLLCDSCNCLSEPLLPTTNKLHKILIRNTVKISYKCMPNMKQIISNHNKTILNKDNSTESKTNNCNCRMSTHAICPVETKQSVGKCKQINF